ncbi:hypothetical protein GCM10011507_33470 [Edaphobacter acidisoli]|uniref:Uncharacterized protein n=1 Tax=Edaphobacter acidisoli TaxID=2040573 RepID=A0A916W9Y7_9BACT|nr:hypothetical protein [Edaphobacter acidisoli]GGA79543.1 hypothetical protein GCM10011507_33470 [Edaphobacter acidisoli]
MSKAIEGAAMLAGAVGMGAAAFFDPALVGSPYYDKLMASLAIGGISMEAGAIASALLSNRGQNITTRQPAAYRQIIRGTQRVGGVTVYQSTTGSSHDQYNFIIVLSGHEVDALENLYLDGRQVHWLGSGPGYSVRNGVGFGGVADNNTYTGPDGQHYNFGGTGHSGIYCEARWGDQADGDVISGMTANDPQWAAVGSRSPYLGGCCYIYLKIEYNPNVFPSAPEIRLTVRGKNNIFDPRTSTYAFTNNWALQVADVIADPTWGLGDATVYTDPGANAQLVAAANICDEQVTLAGGGTESRYCCDYVCDAGIGPGDVLDTMMPGAAGRLSRIGGGWYIWPAAWTAPSFTFDKSALTGPMTWTQNRSLRDLYNRVRGTYIAPNYPYNVAGNLYDSNGWYNGGLQNNFPFAFQPTNFPEYAEDVRHGFASDAWLEDDSGVEGAWSSATTYSVGDVVIYSGGIWKSLQASNTNQTPNAAGSTWWAAGAAYLPKELALRTTLSVSQAQRVAKITLLRNRQQGSGTFSMSLAAWQMQPCDVMSFSFPELNWTNKALEVVSTHFRVEAGASEGEAPAVRIDLGVQETDSSVYTWTPSTDELTPYDLPAGAGPSTSPRAPSDPTSLTVTGNAYVVSTDGVTVVPRLALSWGAPPDAITTQIQIQHAVHASGNWVDDGTVSVAQTAAYITNGIVAGTYYDVRIRSLRSTTGATGNWVEVDNTLAAAPNSLQSSYSINPQFPLTQPTATSIAVASTAATFGSTTVNYAARTLTIPTPSSPTWYYVTIADSAQQGESGSPTLAATASTSTSLVGVQGNTYLGAILALPGGSATQILAGGWPAPQTVQVQ